MLALYDTAHNKLCALGNYSDFYVEKMIGGGSSPIIPDTLHFKYPLEDGAPIDYECYIATDTDEYIVKEINLQTADSGITWVEYVCDLNIEPLKGTLLGSFTPGSVTADNAANLALAGTGWAVGYCDVTKKRTAAKKQCTVYDALSEIAAAYNCEITFDTIGKLVNIHQRQGADRGVYFSEQLNLKQLQQQGNSRDYVTRLYPVGKDGLTISAVNGGTAYVSNYQYSTKIIAAYWIDNRYSSAQDLYDDAVERLEYLSKPARSYSTAIIDLANVSEEWGLFDFSLGDFITLLSESTGVKEQQRIIKIDRYPDEPERSTVELANSTASLDDIILRVSDAAATVENATDTTGAVQGSSVCVTNPDGTFSTLNAAVANIGTLVATKADITDLDAANANISNLQANKVDTTFLTANYITADSISSEYATIDNLNTTDAKITNLKVSTAQISDAAITTAKIALAAITTANVATGAITTALIGTGAVNTAQIADGSITDAKIVTLTANKITAGTIDASKITVTNLNCANLTVGTINGTQIASGAITSTQLASSVNTSISNAQTTANSKNKAYRQTAQPSGTFTAGDIWFDTANGNRVNIWNGSAWALSQFGNAAVANLDAGSITTGSLASARIAAGTITGTQIASTTIAAGNIVTGTITATQIAAGTITATQIASATITGDRLVADTITAREIASACITSNEIAANTITAGNIAAGTITATKIAANTITAAQIAGGTITGDKIAAGTIDASKINVTTLTAQSLNPSGNNFVTCGSVTIAYPPSDTTYTGYGLLFENSTLTNPVVASLTYDTTASPILLNSPNGFQLACVTSSANHAGLSAALSINNTIGLSFNNYGGSAGFSCGTDGTFNVAGLNCSSGANFGSISTTGQIHVSGSVYPQIYGNGSVLQINFSNEGSSNGIVISGGTVRPAGDAQVNLGASGHRWATVYAAAGTINTSDRNEKNSIESLDMDKAMAFIIALNPVSYKFNNGTSGRTHYGMIAQDVEDEMAALGMTSFDFAGLIKSPKVIEKISTDRSGNPELTETFIPGEYLYGLRYEEFIAPLIKTVQGLLARCSVLEKIIGSSV